MRIHWGNRGSHAVVFLICFAAALSHSLAAVAQVPGDVNGNGVVNLADAAQIKDHLLERAALTTDALTRADVNGDGYVDIADVVRTVNSETTETTIYLPGGVPLTLVRVPASSFLMGRYAGEGNSYSYEDPQHTVTIGYDYYMAKTEVTQQQWLALMVSWPDATYNPPNYPECGLGDEYPAYFISWNDCQNFITALNQHITNTGQGPATFRLPSEAEWEYACRAGTQTRFFFGDSLSVGDGATDGPAGSLPGNRSDYMWFYFNCQGNANGACGSKPVGTKLPNQFGLYDMSGNVWEWCQDYWHDTYAGAPTDGSSWLTPTSSYRVFRGGHWYSNAYLCRSAYRYSYTPDSRYYDFGFRLARTP